MSDDLETHHEGPVEEPAESPEVAADTPREEPSLPLLLEPSESAEWRSGGRRGCAVWGCLGGVLLLLALLGVGYYSVRETVWLSFDKRCEQVQEHYDIDVPAADRERLETNLNRFSEHLKTLDDPYPAMGEVSVRMGGALDDRRVSPREARALNRYLESVLPPGAAAGGAQ
jgi:hypothetical protein